MATLEKIRSKSVILFVIIIVALLAFILGDFLTSGRTYFGSQDKMAETNGATVKIDELNAFRSRQQEQDSKEDPEVLEQQYLNTLLLQKLFQKEFEAMGITVTDSELSQWMVNYDRDAQNFVKQRSYELGLPTPFDAATMASNTTQIIQRLKSPEKYQIPAEVAAQYLAQWKAIETQAQDNLQQQLYIMMLQGLFVANDIDAKAMYDGATTRDIEVVMVSSDVIPDEEVEVSDDDIKRIWNENKPKFAVAGDVRSLAYIVQSVQPSEADYAEAQQAVTDMVNALRADSTGNLDVVARDSRFVAQHAPLTKAQLKARYNGATTASVLSRLVDSGAYKGRTEILQAIPGQYYVIGKILNIEEKHDSITFSTISVMEAAQLDSMRSIAAATPVWDSIPSTESMSARGGQKMSLLSISDPKVAGILRDSQIGEVVTYTDSVQGQAINMLIRVDNRPAPVAVYDIARIDYVVNPSNATYANIQGALRNFLGNNATTEAFTANAAEAGYSVEDTRVTNGTPGIAGLPDTRSLVKFAMEGKKGQVSPIVESKIRRNTRGAADAPAILQPVQPAEQLFLVAVALGDETDKYLPWNEAGVRSRLEAEARNLKKAAKLAQKHSGKLGDVNALAADANTNVRNETFSFNTSRYPAAVTGAITKAADGATIEAVETPYGLFVVKVKNTTEPARKFEDAKDQYGQQFLTNFIPFNSQTGILNALRGDHKVKNHSLKFKAGLDD